ncbi:hypothetical protein LX32DRAFT_398779 [Colletotrichum zoysiae]|uniref:Uncharacterized protein n=1 Tax=Colletotrichum zoysiae TaxID=1216348 RepID=A0AAD9HII5_9PEZI|nr:hypothetical protein LX32DRAFT_398779 [Colletotrichum zoysiae]
MLPVSLMVCDLAEKRSSGPVPIRYAGKVTVGPKPGPKVDSILESCTDRIPHSSAHHTPKVEPMTKLPRALNFETLIWHWPIICVKPVFDSVQVGTHSGLPVQARLLAFQTHWSNLKQQQKQKQKQQPVLVRFSQSWREILMCNEATSAVSDWGT